MYNKIKNKDDFLKKIFGYDSFRYGQDEIIESTLNKENNLVIIPTGGGKSLIYQISGSLMKNKNSGKGLTLVISPLISLMKDQVKELEDRGMVGITINSHSTNKEKLEIFNKLKNDNVDFLFLSPEKLSYNKMRDFLKTLNINLFVIDEAHCSSLWGHQFRPEYTQIGKYLDEINNLKSPIISLTATANKKTINDIKDMIYKDKKVITRIGGYYRNNFNLNIIESNLNIEREIADIINEEVIKNNKNGIIYFSTVKELELYKNTIFNKAIKQGIAGFYHGKATKKEREQIQNDFITGKIKFILATTAFGMGVNKSNIDFIIHSGFPSNIESYYQEIGRGGRDGRNVETYLVKQNLKTQLFFIDMSYITSDLLKDVLNLIKTDLIKKNINEIQNISSIGTKALGTDKYNNGLYSYLIKYGYIEKVNNQYILNKKNIGDNKRNELIFKEINEIKKEKVDRLMEMDDFFNIYSRKTIKLMKKYIKNENKLGNSLNIGIYMNILEYFGDVNGIKELIKDKGGKFNFKDIDFFKAYELKKIFKEEKFNKLIKKLENIEDDEDDNDFINELIESEDNNEILNKEEKNKLIIDRMHLF